MIFSAIFPHRYIQGAGALSELGKHLQPLGKNAITVLDPGIAKMMKPKIEMAVQGQINMTFYDFKGESTDRKSNV